MRLLWAPNHMSAGLPLETGHRSARLARQKSANGGLWPPFAERDLWKI
jgi:hypothetical protein